uniref:E3 ubiquitin-protein ligase TRIM39-like n=1 Tax=Pelusios castaneus TaxID=367368 RepID=A0A8C8SQ09_9SAUR
MAESKLVEELRWEVTCSICTQYMQVPVTLDCGHNYCEGCISQHWDIVKKEEEPRRCPLCCRPFRNPSFRQNTSLANVVEIVQRFPSRDEGLDQDHDQEQDVRSRSSTLSGMEFMGQDPQEQQESFRKCLEILKRDLEIVLSFPCDGEMREYLRLFLHDGQQLILHKLQKMEEEHDKMEEGEERKATPDPEQQDEDITMRRSGGETPLKLQPKSEEQHGCKLPILSSTQRIQMKHFRVDVTLDPKTANPELVLSSDRTSVRLGDTQKDLPDYCERFDSSPCILASRGFSSGKYYWEVEVGDNGCWALGVSKGSVRRKGCLKFTPEHGFWTVERHMGKYWALDTSLNCVHCSKRLRRVGIYLDYKEGLVAFYNAETLAHLYTFTTSFTEEIFPFFYTKDKKTPLVINRDVDWRMKPSN